MIKDYQYFKKVNIRFSCVEDFSLLYSNFLIGIPSCVVWWHTLDDINIGIIGTDVCSCHCFMSLYNNPFFIITVVSSENQASKIENCI